MEKKQKKLKEPLAKAELIFIDLSIYDNSPNVQYISPTKTKETFTTNITK